MTYTEAKAVCRNPGAIVHGERFLVINTVTGEPLQSDATLARAEMSAQWCNDHEIRCKRAAVYAAATLDQPTGE